MRIEDKVFQRRQADPARLRGFGFSETEDGYTYRADIADGQFTAVVVVDHAGRVSGRLWDKENDEEYLAVHSELRVGPYVGMVREEYRTLLEEIASSCCDRLPFILPQTNRLTARILERYGEAPDFPFATAKTYGVFRYPQNRKWYGLVMNIPRGKLVKDTADGGEDEDTVEVLNVKIDPARREELLKKEGIYPCYHMDHRNWVSVLLDDTVSDGLLLELIAESRAFAAGKSGGDKSGRRQWLVPANPRYYDIEKAFSREDEPIWKQGKGIKKDDLVFMYVGAPVSAVLYKCRVIETDIPYCHEDKNVTIRKVMKLRVLRKYPPGLMPFSRLNELGVKTVRGPRYAPEEVIKILEKGK
ncbi:MAG: MmcQ/YjbR family DNA-binding protein [Firmicutes bacterium]|nr:MmcQ/YjbR family DNA-binding protein [Bacillota bacterium]